MAALAVVSDLARVPRDGILYFWAEWSPSTAAMDAVASALQAQHPSLTILKCEAEAFPELSSKFSVEVVPTFVFIHGGSVISRVDGANPPEIARQAAALEVAVTGQSPAGPSAEPRDLNAHLAALVGSAPVMLFIKGSASAPKCKFSREIVEILTEEAIQFGTFDILSDEAVRQGLKTYSKWPTYPQLYVNSDLIGGLDILKEMRGAPGALKAELGLAAADDVPPPATATLEERLRSLVGQKRVMVFIKGTPDAPRCGFSSKLVAILKEEGFAFGFFDILEDEEVRQGLKAYSKWPTYPQVYVDSDLIGGLDIVEELRASGELSALKT